MIKEAYVSFELVKLLKEKGFNEATNRYYNAQYDEIRTVSDTFMTYWNNEEHMKVLMMEGALAIPTHQLAMAWLREVYNVFIYVEPFITTNGLQGYKPYCTKIGGEFMWINPLRKYSNTSSDTYYEAVEAALKYSLENLI